MEISVSKKLVEKVREKYISLEYVVGEVIPMIGSSVSKEIPVFFIEDKKETVDFSSEMVPEVESIFSNKWEIGDCVQFLLACGILMEV